MTVRTEEGPISGRPCVGLGLQADCYIYDEVNGQFGVNEADHARWERRLKLLRPGIARIFLPLTDFNPSGDGVTLDWQTTEMKRQIRNLLVLKEAGARVNLCMGPWTDAKMKEEGAETLAVDLVEHLVREEGCDHIQWLCLFNEPDAYYSTGTPLAEEMHKAGLGGNLPLSGYVKKNQRALTLLFERGLSSQIQLVVGDMAWAPRRRLEWLQFLQKDFGSGPATYSFHHYVPEDRALFEEPKSKPYAPPPLPEEMQGYRKAVGEESPLICWEFNEPAWGMGTPAWGGSGLYGEDHLGTFAAAVAHCRKVLTMLGNGIDGMSHWCAGDMFYRSGLPQGVMYLGLWRYKWEGWTPRPYYFYYAALMQTFRPGARLHRVLGLPEGVSGLAAEVEGRITVALLNNSKEAVTLATESRLGNSRLRVMRERFPRRPDIMSREPEEADHPLSDWEAVGPEEKLVLDSQELSLFREAQV